MERGALVCSKNCIKEINMTLEETQKNHVYPCILLPRDTSVCALVF